MKKLTILLFIALFSMTTVVFAAEVNVAPDTPNNLQTAIENASAGDVLILQNDGIYPNQGKLNVTVPLTIKAADGSARTGRAYVQQIAKADGSYDAAAVELRASTTLQGIHFNGSQGSRTAANGRAVRFHEGQIDVHIDNCAFEQYWLRTIDYNDQDSVKLTLTNNIHLWDGRDDRLDNGRVIDFRNSVIVDSLIIENNTFMNCNDRFFRHMNANAEPLQYVRIDHNTFFGNYGYRPPFQFRTVDELIVTNNIVANVGLFGADKSVQGKANRINEIDYDDPAAICIFTITGTDSVNTQVTMKNNNIYNEQRFDDLFALNPDSCEKMPVFNQMFEDKINPATAMMAEELSFANAPSLDDVLTSVQDFVTGTTNFSRVGIVSNFDVLDPDDVDMSYGDAAASRTAADGYPVGDLNWYPTELTDWLAGVDKDQATVTNVAPGLNSLKDAIDAAGPGDVLVLENGGLYPNQGKLNVTVPLTIKAENGSARADRAFVIQVAKADGSYDASAVELRASTTLQGIHFNGSQEGSRTAANGRAVRFHEGQIDVHIDNCAFQLYWLRTIDYNDQDSVKLTLTNNIHLWDGRDDRLDNGRVIDFRNSVIVDSLIIENNTFMNCNDRFFRHMNANAEPLQYVRIDHNTFFGNYGYRPPFQFRTVDELIVTNNIVANVGLFGADKSVQGMANRINEIDYDDPAAICIFTITGTDSVNTQVTMENNNIYNEQRFDDLFALNPDSCEKMPVFNQMFEDKVDVGTAMMAEELSFANAPSLDDVLTSAQDFITGVTNFSRVGIVANFEIMDPDEVDMSYGDAADSRTAADGYPVGDLNWYPTELSDWMDGVIKTDVDNNLVQSRAFALKQNYPNPFNPTTEIAFSIDKASDVKLTVYNMVGQEVKSLVSNKHAAGTYTITWDGTNNTGNMVPSGVYIYELKAGDRVDVKKMILMK